MERLSCTHFSSRQLSRSSIVALMPSKYIYHAIDPWQFVCGSSRRVGLGIHSQPAPATATPTPHANWCFAAPTLAPGAHLPRAQVPGSAGVRRGSDASSFKDPKEQHRPVRAGVLTAEQHRPSTPVAREPSRRPSRPGGPRPERGCPCRTHGLASTLQAIAPIRLKL